MSGYFYPSEHVFESAACVFANQGNKTMLADCIERSDLLERQLRERESELLSVSEELDLLQQKHLEESAQNKVRSHCCVPSLSVVFTVTTDRTCLCRLTGEGVVESCESCGKNSTSSCMYFVNPVLSESIVVVF